LGLYGEEKQMYFDPAGKKIKGPGGGKEIKGRATIYTPAFALPLSLFFLFAISTSLVYNHRMLLFLFDSHKERSIQFQRQ